MCELLGISSSEPGPCTSALRAFRLRGGVTGGSRDGWGVAFQTPRGLALFKAPMMGARSTVFGTLARTIRTGLLIAHVRNAGTSGEKKLEETQPIKETHAGKAWIFARDSALNCLMSDGDYLIAHGRGRLHVLEDTGRVVIATVPLSADSRWTEFQPGELRIYRAGHLVARLDGRALGTRAAVPQISIDVPFLKEARHA